MIFRRGVNLFLLAHNMSYSEWGDIMNQKQINEQYKVFKIPENQVPSFLNANDFAKNFKKCYILKDVSSSYSNTTSNTNKK